MNFALFFCHFLRFHKIVNLLTTKLNIKIKGIINSVLNKLCKIKYQLKAHTLDNTENMDEYCSQYWEHNTNYKYRNI